MATTKMLASDGAAYCPHLTPRECQILELLNVGLSNEQIARRLGITRGSGAARVGRILMKFGGGPRYEVVRRARELGIIVTPKGGGLQPPPPRKPPSRVHLTPRELSVLELMNRGLDNAQIAGRLQIAESAARTYCARVGTTLGGGTRFEVVQAARRLKLVRTLDGVGPAPPNRRRRDVPHLTAREHDTLELMNRGLGNAQIAKALGVGLAGANAYVNHVFASLNAISRYDAVRKARDLGLVRPPVSGGLKEVSLSRFQQRVLRHVARHRTNTQIAERLGRSLDAVTSALQIARDKFKVETTAEAIDRAIDLGILAIPKPSEAANPFSKRDFDVLEGLFAGLMHREIAAEIDMCIGNVGVRIARMKSRLRVHSTEELLDEVERLNLYEPRLPRKRLVERKVLAKRKPPSYGVIALTPRQIEVIEALARHPNTHLPVVASDLGISPHTLIGHLMKIRHRMGVRLSSSVAAEAQKLGIIRSRAR